MASYDHASVYNFAYGYAPNEVKNIKPIDGGTLTLAHSGVDFKL